MKQRSVTLDRRTISVSHQYPIKTWVESLSNQFRTKSSSLSFDKRKTFVSLLIQFVGRTYVIMASQTHEFNVEMTCEGCSGAVERVLGNKAGIENVKIDLPGKKVYVTTSLSSEEVLGYLKKTGKASSYVGSQK